MIRFLSLVLSLMLASLATADERDLREASTVCEASLLPMRDAMATLRQGQSLTTAQEALWGTWNVQCRHASWQQALAEGLPPARTEYPPNPTKAQLWLKGVGRVIEDVDSSGFAPVTTCRTTVVRREARAGAYTTCTTH